MPPHARERPPRTGASLDPKGRLADLCPRIRRPGRLTLLALLAAPGLAAQESSAVAGIVVDAQSGVPVPDVVVAFDRMELLAYTDSAGRFRIQGVPAGSRSFVFRHLAYGEHSRDVVVGEGGAPLELEVRISQAAIELSPLVVDVMSEAERQRLGSGFALRELGFEEIQEAQRQGLLLEDLVRRVPGIRFRRINVGGAARDCIEYRTYGTGNTCRDMAIVMDGVRMASASMILNTMDLDEIQRLEVLSPGEAGMRYGMSAGFGVLVVETRTGQPLADLERVGPMSPFDWDVEAEPYGWWRVFATSFVANAAAVGLTSLPLSYCTHVLDGSLSSQPRCNRWAATGVGVAAIALPGAAAGAVGSWAGTTPLSRGHRGWAMSLGTLSNWAGALLYFTARSTDSEARQILGLSILALGTPLLVTVSDRFFRRLR
jgi:hypothetical protein